jgi:hypothetical protein
MKASSASASTYYVSNSGNDFSPGILESQPWQTIEKVNNSVFQPGDSILFEKGDVWHGQIKPVSSGIEGNPIKFETYGEGEKPIIINGKFFPAGSSWSGPNAEGEYTLDMGSMTEFPTSSLVGVLRAQPSGVDSYKRVWRGTPGSMGEDQFFVENLGGHRIIHYKPPASHFPGEYDWEFSKWNGTVFFGTDISWVTVDGFIFLNSYYNGLSDPGDTGAIDFFGSHCAVKNSIIKFSNAFGVEFAGPASQHNTLENCDIEYSRAAGVDLRLGASHNIVRGCHIANNSLGDTTEETFNDRGGIMTLGSLKDGSVSSILIEGNIIHDNGNKIPTRNNAAILLDGCEYWTIKNNHIYNSPRRAIATSDNDGSVAPRNHHNNIIGNMIARWDKNRENYSWNTAIFVTARGNDENSGYNKIENNTIFSDDDIPLIGINMALASNSEYMKNTNVRNNIIYLANNSQADSLGIRVNRNNLPGSIIDNNLVFGALNPYELAGTKYSDAEDFYGVTGFGQNDKNSDPLFANSSGDFSQSSDFKLSAGSPAIDAGADVGLTADFEGTPVPQGASPDIGAFEYHAGAPQYRPADLNQDNSIDSTDLDILKTDFLKLTANLSNSRSDINGDGQCTVRDLGILMSGWK